MSLVFCDVETTSLDPATGQIWQLAFATEDSNVEEQVVHHTLAGADPVSLEMNHYFSNSADPDAIRWSMAFEAAWLRELEGATLVAANPAFDAAFLKARWGRAPWKYRMIDIESYALPYLGSDEPLGLAAIAEELGIEAPDHSAGQDVKVLRQCYFELQARYDQLMP